MAQASARTPFNYSFKGVPKLVFPPTYLDGLTFQGEPFLRLLMLFDGIIWKHYNEQIICYTSYQGPHSCTCLLEIDPYTALVDFLVLLYFPGL